MTLSVAVGLYQDAIVKIPFVPELPPERPGRVEPARPSRALAAAIAGEVVPHPPSGTPSRATRRATGVRRWTRRASS